MAEEQENTQSLNPALEALNAKRETVRGNMQIVRPLFIDKRFALLCLWMGFISTVLFGCLVAAEFLWQSTAAAPYWAKFTFGAVCLILFAAISIGKLVIIDRAAKERDKSFNTIRFSMLPEVMAMLVDTLFTMAVVAVLCILIARTTGNWRVFLPGLFLYSGFAFFIAANRITINEYRILVIISYAFTIFISVYMKSHYMLWATGSIGLFSYVAAVFFYAAAKHGEQSYAEHSAE